MAKLNRKIAAQLWTVRSLCGDEKGLATTLAALKAIGYDGVELIGLGSIPPAVVRRILDDTGISACSAHADSQQILSDPGSMAAMLHTVGCSCMAYPYPRNQDVSSAEGVGRLCKQLANAASVFHAEGISFYYHNHSIELQRLGDKTVLQMIMEQTDPKLMGMELDTYWLQAGGVDTIAWIQRCKGRAALLHVKDYKVGTDGKPLFGEIGSGNFDWDKILSTAAKAGTEWLIVEQDDHWTGGNPLGSLETSWKYLSRR